MWLAFLLYPSLLPTDIAQLSSLLILLHGRFSCNHSTMASFLDNAYSLVHLDNTADQPSLQDLRVQLEKGNDETKMETMRNIITIMLNGDPMPQLLMHIIRFVMPSKSKSLKKLLYFYYEICPKHDTNGKLKQEMILVWYEWAPGMILLTGQ